MGESKGKGISDLPLLTISFYHTIPGSTNCTTIESKLMLEWLSATSALEEYRTAMAEQFALRNVVRKREELRAALEQTAQPPSSNPLALLADLCATTPAKPKSAEWLFRHGTSRAPPVDAELPSLCASRRSSDASHSSLSSEKAPLSSPFKKTPPRKTQCWDVAISFPSKLFHMLAEADKAGHADIVSFLPHGKAFMIHKPEAFATEILPKYFKTNRLSSFQKQLSLYGFKRVKFGADLGAIRHDSFQRDDKKLVAKIQRKRQGVPVGEPMNQRKERVAIWKALGVAAGRQQHY